MAVTQLFLLRANTFYCLFLHSITELNSLGNSVFVAIMAYRYPVVPVAVEWP